MSKSCKGCTTRAVGCHADCSRYAADKARFEAAREQRRIDNIGYYQEVERFIRRGNNAQEISRRRQGF